MKTFRKAIVLVLALVFLMMAFSACGKNDEYKGMDHDELGYYTLDEDGYKVYKINMYEFGYVLPDVIEKREQVQEAINDKLAEDLGFKIDVTTQSVDAGRFNTKVQAALGNGETIDLIRWYNKELVNYVSNDLLLPLDDYMQYMPDFVQYCNEFNANVLQECTVNGELYSLPDIQYPLYHSLYYRGDFLKELGFVDNDGNPRTPTTFVEFEDYLEKVKSKLTGTSTTSIATALYVFEPMILGYFTETPAAFYSEEEDCILPVFFAEGYRDYVEKMAEWVEKGYLNKEMLYKSDETGLINAFRDGAAGVYCSNVYMLDVGPLHAVDVANPNLMIKSGAYFDDQKAILAQDGFALNSFMIPYTAKSAGAVIKLYNWAMKSEENYTLITKGIEGVTYEKNDQGGIITPEEYRNEGKVVPNQIFGKFIVGGNSRYDVKQLKGSVSDECYNAYDRAVNNAEWYEKVFVSPQMYTKTQLDDFIQLKSTTASNNVNATLQKFIKGEQEITDAAWEAMLQKYRDDGGLEAMQVYTEIYKSLELN